MKYVMAYAGSRLGPRPLEEGATRASVGAECRVAALEFMAGVASGWDKLDLVRWLTGPYTRATRHAQRGERTFVANDDGRGAGALVVDPAALEELLTTERGRVLAALEKAALSGGALDFTTDAIELGLVRRATDQDGTVAWIPVDGARMRLVDRVRSLFAADYLDDPASYAALYVCHRCEAVVFDEDARALGMCSLHRRQSGIVTRGVDEPETLAVGDD